MFLLKRDGAITVFLSIILAAILVLTCVFVEAARIRSGETQVQDAVDLSSNSILADYNSILKEMFGLMAISDNDPGKLRDEMLYYLERTLNVPESSSQKGGNYFDLYGFKVDELNALPIYNLAEPEVLRAQILEYMKYKAPKELAEGFLDKILAFKDFKKQADTMKKKLDVDKDIEDLRKTQEKASDKVLLVNSFGKLPDDDTGNAEENLPERLNKASKLIVEKIGFEKQIKDLKAEISDLNKSKKPIQDEIANLQKQIAAKKKAATKKKPADTSAEEKKIAENQAKLAEIDSKISEKQSALSAATNSYNDRAAKLSNIKESIDAHISEALDAGSDANNAFNKIKKDSPEITGQIDKIAKSIKDDNSDFAKTTRTDLGSKKTKIDATDMDNKMSQVSDSISKINSVKSIIDRSPIDKLNLDSFNGIVPDDAAVNSKIGTAQIKGILEKYNGYINENTNAYKPIDYIVLKQPKTNKGDQKDPRDFAKEEIKKFKEKNDSNSSSEIKENIYSELPSQLKSLTEDSAEIISDKKYIDKMLGKMKIDNYVRSAGKMLDNAAEPDIQDADIDSSKNIFSALDSITEFLEKGMLSIRDELYIDEYAMGTFKNITSGKGENKSEYDLRGELKSSSKSAFVSEDGKKDNNAEIEYILWGKKNINSNATAVKAEILAIRFILNTISIYTDPVKFNTAMEAAWLVAGWIGGIGVPFAHTLIMLAWSMAESVVDVSLLTSGKSVPIFKTPDTWILSPKGGLTYIAEATEEKISDAAKKTIDYVSGISQDKVKDVAEKISANIKARVEQSVNAAFSTIEGPFQKMTNSFDNAYEDILNGVTDYADSEVSGELKEIDKKIAELVPESFNKIKKSTDATNDWFDGNIGFEAAIKKMSSKLLELETNYNRAIAGKSKKAIENLKADLDTKKADIIKKVNTAINQKKEYLVSLVMSKISEPIKSITLKVNNKISKLSNAAKEMTGELLDNSGGKTKSGLSTSNLKSSFLSMKYSDYLRLFLLMTNSDKKVKRIGDLIQLRTQRITNSKGFKLSEANTYLRVNAKVSIKYFFMAQQFIPKEFRTPDGKRHEYNITLYKGY